jgi:hypothetical protein
MKIHPDILACHAQFGGDLEDMQRRYESAPDMRTALVRAERKLAAYVGVCNGNDDSSYRQQMVDAGRGHLLR